MKLGFVCLSCFVGCWRWLKMIEDGWRWLKLILKMIEDVLPQLLQYNSIKCSALIRFSIYNQHCATAYCSCTADLSIRFFYPIKYAPMRFLQPQLFRSSLQQLKALQFQLPTALQQGSAGTTAIGRRFQALRQGGWGDQIGFQLQAGHLLQLPRSPDGKMWWTYQLEPGGNWNMTDSDSCANANATCQGLWSIRAL